MTFRCVLLNVASSKFCNEDVLRQLDTEKLYHRATLLGVPSLDRYV